VTDWQQDGDRTLSVDERAELEQLRAEVTQLRAGASAAEGSAAEGVPAAPVTRRRRTWPRTVVAYVLIGLAALLAPLAVVSVWARSQVSDTDRYVETVAPLASDPALQAAATTQLTNIAFQYLDVQGLTQQALDALASSGRVPPALSARLDALVVPISNGIYSFTEDQVGSLVRSDVFADAWATANRTAHDSLVAALTGETGGPVEVTGNTVSVNLATFITAVKERLIARGFTLAERIPAVNAQFTIFQSADLPKVQQGYRVLNTLGFWLPFVVLALIGIGAYVAPGHRRALIVAGLAVTLGMLLVALLLALARRRYLDAVPTDQLPRDAATVLFDTVVRFLREGLRSIALVGLALALGAFLTGPSVTATAVRGLANRAAAGVRLGLSRLGLHLGGVTSRVAPLAGTLRAVAVAVAIIALIVPAYLTPAIVLWVLAVLLAVLFVIAVLAAPEPPPRAARAESQPDGLAPAEA
jgi:hypothetical protein